MSSFRRHIDQHRRFIIGVKIFPPVQNNAEFERSTKDAATYRALVDTGANNCCISEKVVADLKLQPYSQSEMVTAGGLCTTSSYMVGISVSVMETEMRQVKQQDGTISVEPHTVSESSKTLPRIKVNAVPDINQDRGFDVILGMNMLTHFHITIHQEQIIISI